MGPWGQQNGWVSGIGVPGGMSALIKVMTDDAKDKADKGFEKLDKSSDKIEAKMDN